MQLPLRIDFHSGQSLQLQIFEQIRRLITDGRLKPSTRMPASRVLADDLGVSRNTVVHAYEKLVGEGYLEMRKPVGAFVSTKAVVGSPMPAVELTAEDSEAFAAHRRERLVFRGESHFVISPYDRPVLYDFWVGRPDARVFPAKIWQQISRQLHETHVGNSAYGHPGGLWELRQAIADHVGAARGIRTTAHEVIVTHGIQEGLNVIARMFITGGTPVAVENPCYLGAANVFRSHGAQLLPTAVDSRGVDVERLPKEAAFIYVTPSHQYPTGSMLSPERRMQLLEWALRTHAYVVEDDYDSDFFYDSAPLPALKSLDKNDQVIYMGTFSKSLGAGLRVGYMIVPPHLASTAIAIKGLMTNCMPWFTQAVLAEFMASGAFQHHLRRTRMIYNARRDFLIRTLSQRFGGSEIYGAQAGMHLAWELPHSAPAAFDLERLARSYGVGVYSFGTGNALLMGDDINARYARSVMLGFAALDEREIDEGVRRLVKAAGYAEGASRRPSMDELYETQLRDVEYVR